MRLVPWKKLFRIAVVCSTFSLVYHLFTRYTNLIEQVALATNITLSEDQRLIKPYIRGTCPGRLALGNVIGCFETLWAFSIRYKLQVVFPDKELAVMKKTFKNIGESVLSESEFKKLSQQGLKWRKVQNANVFFLEQESCNPTIDIEQYKKMHGRKPACHPISMEENIRIEDKVPVIMAALLPFRTEITHQLEFVDSVNKEADYVIGKVGDLYSNPVFIGVHVRRTDYARYLHVCWDTYMFAGYTFMFTEYTFMFDGHTFMFAGYTLLFAGHTFIFAGYFLLFAGHTLMFAVHSFTFAGYTFMFAEYTFMFTGYTI
ncbi:uncharacterized protein LOC111705447 isoform X2 [Eurytemora carolleeae]|uniref:uncharacterized protein LOC111705447 isoform X2 n=1 Tax=Eurytemora carolleeae TaxID=1294199 RepID=UPI000C77346E|nr:uncharacterized protein LOC111705447 isoform X2 [Eurytemora carolleeae]|eukprot:XP_023333768.1 uncharacterized protein LOC111705447 isoform X2 [Eurytemora affinis]